MRAIAGGLVFMAIVMLAVIMVINEWNKGRKNNSK
jgi:hypothetical protein